LANWNLPTHYPATALFGIKQHSKVLMLRLEHIALAIDTFPESTLARNLMKIAAL